MNSPRLSHQKTNRANMVVKDRRTSLLNQLAFNQNPELEHIVHIINKKHHMKQQDDLVYIDRYLANNEFLHKLKQTLAEKQYYQLLKELKYEIHPKFSPQVNFGDVGRKFYIILKGKMLVLTPIKTDISLSSSYNIPEEMLEMLAINYPNFMVQGILETGQAFGEIALLYDQPRSATILPLEDCQMLFIGREGYKKIIESHQKDILNSQLQFLMSIPLLIGWDKSALNILLYDVTEHAVMRGQKVYTQNETADSIYIVKEGEIVLSKKIENQKASIQLAIIGSNMTFGEEEIIINAKKRTHSAICYSTIALLLKIKKQKFIDNIPNNQMMANFYQTEKQKLDVRKNLTDKAIQIISPQVQIHSQNRIPLLQLALANTVPLKNSILIRQPNSERNLTKTETLKQLLKERILMDSFANYQKKRFNGPVTQEMFFATLKQEKFKLSSRHESQKQPVFKLDKRPASILAGGGSTTSDGYLTMSGIHASKRSSSHEKFQCDSYISHALHFKKSSFPSLKGIHKKESSNSSNPTPTRLQRIIMSKYL